MKDYRYRLFWSGPRFLRNWRTCFRCGGTGRFDSGEKCYYCQGTGRVDD